jgi:hypothetical protein
MNRLSASILFSITAFSCTLGWEYPKEFYPPEETNFEGKLPRHANVEFFIQYLSTGGERISRPNPKDFGQKPTPIYLGQMMSYDPPFPTAKFAFFGGDSEGDHYTVSFQAAAPSKAQTKEIIYSGSILEVWRNKEFAVGIRPAKEQK